MVSLPMDNYGRIWITWESQRRNRELSRALGIELHEFAEIDAISNPFRKYLIGIGRTLRLLLRTRPGIIICQNPSLILTILLIFVQSFSRIKVIVDAHNAGIFPGEGRSPVLGCLARFAQKKAVITLITNNGLADVVKKNGGLPFILQDKIPSLPEHPAIVLRGKHNILFICSFAADEPYEAIFSAASLLPKEIFIYVTGNYTKKQVVPPVDCTNLVLTGFLPEDQYVAMLNSVDATIDLTTRENCLVCGAYESLAAGKPMILSNTAALRDYFSKGAVYSGHTAPELAAAIKEIVARKEALRHEVLKLRDKREAEWLKRKELLLGMLAEMENSPRREPIR